MIKKGLVFIKWFLLMVPLGLFGILTSWIGYPLWEFFRWRVFWIYGDDDALVEEDYHIFLENRGGDTFFNRWIWHGFRNRMWNLRTFIEHSQKGDGSGLTDIDRVIDDLWLNGKQVHDGDGFKQEAGLKYKGRPGQNPWQVWSGDVIDFKYSIIGEGFMWFKQDGILSFRYSYCKLHYNRWVTIKVNIFKADTVLAFKIQKNN